MKILIKIKDKQINVFSTDYSVTEVTIIDYDKSKDTESLKKYENSKMSYEKYKPIFGPCLSERQ